jgi:hypothetical protein
VKYATPGGFRDALEQRLRTRHERTGESIQRLRKLVAFDRFLARLIVVAPGQWVLKGGLALDYRLRDRARTTVDIDLHRADSEDDAAASLRAAEVLDLGDHFYFTVARTLALDDADVGGAVRHHVRCELAGRLFDEFDLDMGFADSLVLATDELQGPDLMSFAGLNPVVVPALSLPQHVAEKVHAYTRRYGIDGRPSTRVKDLIDLVLVAMNTTMRTNDLRSALRSTFDARASHELPTSLPPPPPEWAPRYRTDAAKVAISEDLGVGHRAAAAFLDPVLDASVANDTWWDPETNCWRSGVASRVLLKQVEEATEQ